jgi:hypothetical protein
MTRCGIKLKARDDFKSMKSVPDKQRRTHFEKDPAGSKIAKHHSLICILSGTKSSVQRYSPRRGTTRTETTC